MNRPPLPKQSSLRRYHAPLVRLQIELVKLKRCVIERGDTVELEVE